MTAILNENTEILLDKIAEALITSPYVNLDKVRLNQKTIRNGLISLGRSNSDKLILFQKDIKANEEDLNLSTLSGEELFTLGGLANNIEDFNSIEIVVSANGNGDINSINLNHNSLSSEGGIELLLLLTEVSESGDLINPLNISQFFNVEQTQTIVNPEQANEFLDTNIFELLPGESQRQEEIDKFYTDLQNLLPPETPNFDGDDDDEMVDRDEFGNWMGSEQYYLDNSIAATQDDFENATINQDVSYITRLSSDGDTSSQNSGKTIEDIYNIITPYLTDILEDDVLPEDDRPEYENQSDGYLKFRNLNQGIIVRNTDSEFIESLNSETKDYLTTGFTISMWVRFLDKTSSGTLFNFGNPTRKENPFGFRLETYVLNKDDENPDMSAGFAIGTQSWGSTVESINGLNETQIFKESNTARFVRLITRIGDPTSENPLKDDTNLKDSHLGVEGSRKFSWNIGDADYETFDYSYSQEDETKLLQTTHIPEDFKEWYFICATFNPVTIEPVFGEEYYDANAENSNFWMNHVNPVTEQSVAYSGYGNKCKVEIISRTDLLRARGYKV